jgi:hypothetical protein
VVPEPNGGVNVKITVTDSDGVKIIVSEIPPALNEDALRELEDMGLNVTIDDGEIVIEGAAVDIGTVELVVVLGNGETKTVTFTVDPILERDTKTNKTPSEWTGSIIPSGSGVYTFTVFVPIDLTADEISRVEDVDAVVGGGVKTGVSITTRKSDEPGRGAGESAFVRITGTTENPDDVAVTSVTYRIGIHKYTQEMNVKLADTAVTTSGGSEPAPSTSSGGGGCDAGAGSAALFALMVAAILGRKAKR